MGTKNPQDALKETQDELARIKAREALNKNRAEEQIHALQSTVGKLREELLTCQEVGKKLSQEKKRLATAVREAKQNLRATQAEMRQLQTRLPALEHLLGAADFLQSLPGQLRTVGQD